MFNFYPYTDFHEMNLDMIIAMIKKLTGEIHDFKVINKITFFGDWDITKQYPAWSIVNNGGDGYISIKPVPQGIDITNTDYWVMVANYSALYADMQNRIVALEGEMTNVQTRVQTLEYVVTGDEIVLFGDSWTDPLNVDHHWAEEVATNAGLTIHNYANSGKAYYHTNPDRMIDAEITWAENDLNDHDYDGNNVKKVFFIAGVNDGVFGNNPAIVVTNMLSCATRAKGLFPNAEIIFVVNSAIGQFATAYSTYNYRQYSNALVNGISSYYPVYNTLCWFKPSDYYSDGYHLTVNNKTMQRNMLSLMKNEGCDTSVSYTNNITQVNGLGGAVHLYIDITGSNLTVKLDKVAALAAGDYSVVLPAFCLFDNYGGLFAKFMKADGTITFIPVYPDFVNGALTFTTTETLYIHDTLEFLA